MTDGVRVVSFLAAAMKDHAEALVGALRRGRLALTIEGSTFIHALLTGDAAKGQQPGLQLASPREIPRYHLTVFLDGGELVFLVSDQDQAAGPGRVRHPWSVRVPLAAAFGTLERVGTGPVGSFGDRLTATCRVVSLEAVARVWVLVGLFDGGLSLEDAPFSRRRGTRLEAAMPRARFVTGQEFFASDYDHGLVVEPGPAGDPIVRWFVPRLHNGTNTVVADFEAMTTELVTFSSWLMNQVRPVVRADFTLPEIPEARILLGDAVKNLHRSIAGLRLNAGLLFPWDPDFTTSSGCDRSYRSSSAAVARMSSRQTGWPPSRMT